MALASAKYDVILAGQGYILVAESYTNKSQQPFVPRFSTGEDSLRDLSFWQFMNQTDFSGGEHQLDFSDQTKIQKSTGWSLLTGKPRLAGGNAPVSGLAAGVVQLANTEPVGASTTDFPVIHQMLPFGKTADGRKKLLLVGVKAAGFAADGTTTTLRSPTAALIGLHQLNAYGACRWNRQLPASGDPGFLMVGQDTGLLKVYDAAMAVSKSYDLHTYVTPRCNIYLDHNTTLHVGPLTSGAVACLGLVRLLWSANSWGDPTVKPSRVTDVPATPSPIWARDSDGTTYIVLPSELVATTNESFSSTVMAITATDALLADGPVPSEVIEYPDHYLMGAVNVGGDIYLVGARADKTAASPTYRACVLKFPHTVIWESPYTSSTPAAVLPRTLYTNGRNEAYFFDKKTDSGEMQKCMRITAGGVVQEIFTLSEDTTLTPCDPAAMARVGQTMYVYDRAGNQLQTMNANPTDTRTGGKPLTLTTSRYGGNTPLIEKALYSAMLELTQAVPVGQTLTVQANGTTIGTMSSADGLRKEIILTTEVTGGYFEIALVADSTCTWTGELSKLILRYVPTQFRKQAWGFGIRADSNLRLGDRTLETTKAPALVAAIKAAYESKVPIAFTDVDGTEYQVLVTEFQVKRMLINNRGGNRLEAFVFVELLQV
jgi:hypothetical protein